MCQNASHTEFFQRQKDSIESTPLTEAGLGASASFSSCSRVLLGEPAEPSNMTSPGRPNDLWAGDEPWPVWMSRVSD